MLWVVTVRFLSTRYVYGRIQLSNQLFCMLDRLHLSETRYFLFVFTWTHRMIIIVVFFIQSLTNPGFLSDRHWNSAGDESSNSIGLTLVPQPMKSFLSRQTLFNMATTQKAEVCQQTKYNVTNICTSCNHVITDKSCSSHGQPFHHSPVGGVRPEIPLNFPTCMSSGERHRTRIITLVNSILQLEPFQHVLILFFRYTEQD